MADRQQFNVNLAPELVRRIKHHAVDAQLSLSDLVGRVLEQHLHQESTVSNSSAHSGARPADLALSPLVHVEQMTSAVTFYEALGATVLHGSRDGDFVLLQVGAAQLGLLAHPPNPAQGEGRMELAMTTSEPLEQLEQRLADSGVTIWQPTTDEGFGRQLQLASPDGLLIKVNQLEPDLYT